MKRTFSFGKIAYGKQKIPCNEVAVTINLSTKTVGKGRRYREFTASGEIWNNRHTDTIAFGQCLDTIHEYIHTPLFEEIYDLWKHYHLNGMRPYCEHQKRLGWDELSRKKVTLYHWRLDPRVSTRQRKIEETALTALKQGNTVTLNSEQVQIANLKYEIVTDKSELPEPLTRFYVPCKPLYQGDHDHEEIKTLGWLRPSQHPDGLLGRPCPVCGYKYGTAWLHEEIPEQDEARIISLIMNGEPLKAKENPVKTS